MDAWMAPGQDGAEGEVEGAGPLARGRNGMTRQNPLREGCTIVVGDTFSNVWAGWGQ